MSTSAIRCSEETHFGRIPGLSIVNQFGYSTQVIHFLPKDSDSLELRLPCLRSIPLILFLDQKPKFYAYTVCFFTNLCV